MKKMKKLFIILALGSIQNAVNAMRRTTIRRHPAATPMMRATMRSHSSAPRPLGPLQHLERYRDEAFEQQQKALESVEKWKKVMHDCADNGCSKNCKPYNDCVSQHDEHLKLFQAARDKNFDWARKFWKLQEYMKQ